MGWLMMVPLHHLDASQEPFQNPSPHPSREAMDWRAGVMPGEGF
jgi:hypothetical protein